MDADKRDIILAVMRHEFSKHSTSALKAEFERRKTLEEYSFDIYILSKTEMIELFELLIKERT